MGIFLKQLLLGGLIARLFRGRGSRGGFYGRRSRGGLLARVVTNLLGGRSRRYI